MSYTVSKLLEIACAELGYKEKETNSRLDDKTANAGDGNWTKYARDLHSAGYYQSNKNGYAWCDIWVDWVFLQLCNGDAGKAQKIICQTGPYGAGCKFSADYYKQAGRFYTSNPQPGDQIFFNNYAHTGIVEKIVGSIVHTIEGNTSNMVARRTYTLGSSTIDGYGRPVFDLESVDDNRTATSGSPSTGSAADEQTIWNFLMAHIDNEYGVAGLMGNLYAESALRSNNLQQSYENKLGYSDTTYTAAVDNCSYDNFVKDSAGYGLAQWTYWSRKQAMLEFHRFKNKSIGDLRTQLEFLVKELSESYSGVWHDLRNATNILDASNSVLLKFERPANQGESVQKKRAEYGQKYYDKYADKHVATNPEASLSPPTPAELKFKVGDIVNFAGTNHYASANASTGPKVKAGKAKITAVYKNGKHPYHCRAINNAGAFIGGVYGWVNAADLSPIAAETPATKPSTNADDSWTPKVGDIVNYTGNKHYVNANAANGSSCNGGKAKITNIYQLGKSKHPYHLVRVSGKGATVYGWVDEGTFTKA